MISVCAESIRVMCPLFQTGEGGSIPTSALQLGLEECSWEFAETLNRKWHSMLPQCDKGTMSRGFSAFFSANFQGVSYAVAIWSSPVARGADDGSTSELRRLAIAPDAPKNTASRMLAVMALLMKRRHPALRRLISYQAVSVHKGTIYKAAGWQQTLLTKFHPWGTRKKRKPRSHRQRVIAEDCGGHVATPSTRRPSQIESDKQRWEKPL